MGGLFKDRRFISAGKPVQKLGQSVAGGIIGEPHSRHPVWKNVLRMSDCLLQRRNMLQPSRNEGNIMS